MGFLDDNYYFDFTKYLIENEVIEKDLEPRKCRYCDRSEFIKSRSYYEEGYECEYTLTCKICLRDLATWAYGSWQLEDI